MAKFDLKFIDCVDKKDYIQVQVYRNIIAISGEQFGECFEICLDKSTSIKFAKTLRTEINKITESEVSNG